ncbi:two-component sensor histidine kinase [Labilithrix luteola]|uniref:histidine kinase n=1 Tax=Labilithrix luteola TaxID=1391654 RepID=A0A0K1Q6Q7_9BACT|nr:ATP-binding protein [Labilithrix luteola]AKV01399.1 two-component sensor histidine kinase [Labilithrix luteola]
MPMALDYRQLFERSPNPYMVLDGNLCFVAANRAYLDVTASKLEDLVGRNVFDVFPNDPSDPNNESVRLLRSSIENVLKTGKAEHVALVRYRIARAPGEPPEDRFWSATHTPLLDETGKVAYVVQHTVDVTNVRTLGSDQAWLLGRAFAVQQANVTLDAELRHLRSLFDQAPGFVAVFRGPEHVLEIHNQAFAQLVGPRSIAGARVRDALPEVDPRVIAETLDTPFATGKPFTGREQKIALRRGKRQRLENVYLDVVCQPFFDARGKVAGIFVQGTDVTARRLLEDQREALERERSELLARETSLRAQAEEANRLKDEFLATVSHELRTPLSGVIGWLQLLRMRKLADDRRAIVLDTVERNARALAQLVDDLLDVSRIVSGKMALTVQTLEVARTVEAALEVVQPAAAARGVTLTSALDTDLTVLADPSRLQQVVWNLVTNAVKFTPRGGRVHVAVRRIDSTVEISVSDTGMGIDEGFLPFVFERFRQADGGRTRRHGGLGLGLAIVKHLVELHGGTVSAESEGPGKGACFRVSLPIAVTRRFDRASNDHERDDEEEELAPELGGVRILLVEDDAEARQLVQEILVEAGATVTQTASVAEALSKLDESTPDLVLSDVGMPGQDGFDLIRRIRSRPKSRGGRVPAVALTAFARTEDRTRLLRAGFQAHVPKPVDIPELLAVLATLAPSSG